MARNPYFSMGVATEQNLLEDLIIESIQVYGQDFLYIPRTLVAKDEILGEDRLSKFENAYPVEMYLESVDGFEGQGAFIQKFGLMMEQSATLTVARKTWQTLVGDEGTTILPNRPCEGDLLYFPLTKGLFESKFVQHQDPFYQLGKLYVYKLQVELFQYSSEIIDTGVPEVDVFESLKTFDTEEMPNIRVPDSYGDNENFKQEAESIVVNKNNVLGNVPKQDRYTADSTVYHSDRTKVKSDFN
jgi:hypothetical protein